MVGYNQAYFLFTFHFPDKEDAPEGGDAGPAAGEG